MLRLQFDDQRGSTAVGAFIGVVGFVLMVGSLLGWFFYPDEEPETTVTEVTEVLPAPEPIPDSVVHEESTTTTEPAPSSTVTTVDKTTTTTNRNVSMEKTTTTVAPKATKRSEGLFLAMFGAGFVLLLAGVFSDRIQSITGPGGIGIVLKAVGKDTAEAIASLESVIEKHNKRIRDANARITELRKRVTALEAGVGPLTDEALVAEIQEDEELRAAEAELDSAREGIAAADAARERLLQTLNDYL